MGQGYLKIDVKTANGALPVEGAQVTISDQNGQALYHLTTNADGQTSSISLYAPDRATSLQPGGEAYSKYNVTVTKDGYTTENIIGADIFDGIRQTQPVYLHPSFSGGSGSETIVVDENALKQPEPQIEQLEPTRPTRVLTDVIIPSNITVHMGYPNDTSAQNITVSFPDYIKNEMYTKRQTLIETSFIKVFLY